MGTTATQSANTVFTPPTSDMRPGRIGSLDIARGLVMVLMAVDHVRVYSGVPAGGPNPGVFFTRWITHFAAPAFAFLAGTGAFLYGAKLGDRRALAKYLALRGAFLVALELTVLREAWTFNVDVLNYNLAGVLWMLGWCMILMAALVQLPVVAVGVVGIAIVLAQNVFEPLGQLLPSALGKFVYLGGGVQLGVGGPPILILYVIVPWIGVMAAGYWFGTVMTRAVVERRRLCRIIGWTLTLAFLAIASGLAFTHGGAQSPPAWFRILNQRKYPASQLFLMMTLGPTILFIGYAEAMHGAVARALTTFGRVPLFYYVLHIPLIHATALVVSLVRQGSINPWLFANHPLNPGPVPGGYRWSLPLLYLVLAVVISLLYLPCRWYAGVKARDRTGLLRFL